MFKNGQLVRSTRTGWYHVVDGNYLGHHTHIYVRCVSRKTRTPLLCVPSDEMTLIGNNYRAKTKCSR